MQPGLSTYALLPQRLHPGHLDLFAQAGVRTVEIHAARCHFDYADKSSVRELGVWFRANEMGALLHMPLTAETNFSRHAPPSLNLVAPEKFRRIDAMDEIKRAIETAEQVPFSAVTLHLGLANSLWSAAALEHALTAIEHLKAFATTLGVRLLLENLVNEVATPAHLLEVLEAGHFRDAGVCFDLGHAHLAGNQAEDGILPALALLAGRVGGVHINDNDGTADQHLWPGTAGPGTAGPGTTRLGTPLRPGIDWASVLPKLREQLPAKAPWIFEISYDLHSDAKALTKGFVAAVDGFRRVLDAAPV